MLIRLLLLALFAGWLIACADKKESLSEVATPPSTPGLPATGAAAPTASPTANPCGVFSPEGKAASEAALGGIANMDAKRSWKWQQVVPTVDLPTAPTPPDIKQPATAFKGGEQEDYEAEVAAYKKALQRVDAKLRSFRAMFDPYWGRADLKVKNPGELSQKAQMLRVTTSPGCQVLDVTGGCEKACWQSYCGRTQSDGKCLVPVRTRTSLSKCSNAPSMYDWGMLCSGTIQCLADPHLKNETAGLRYEAAMYGLRIEREFSLDDTTGKAEFQKAVSAVNPGDVVVAENANVWTYEKMGEGETWVATTKELPKVTATNAACRAYRAANPR